MKRLVPPVVVALMATLVVAAPVQAAPAARSYVDPCAQPAPLSLDVEAAASLRITPGRGKKMRPAGLAKARAFATQLTSGADPCADPLEDYQDVLSDIQASIDAGDIEATRELLIYYIESVTPYEPDPEPVTLTDQPSAVARVATARAAGACEGFESHDVKPPAEIGLALELGQIASLVGDDEVAGLALEAAQKATLKWVESGADGTASSLPDYLRLAHAAMLMALDDEVAEGLLDKARAVALESYKLYNLVPCRMTQEKVDCFFKSAMALTLLGSEAVSDSQMSEDIASAATAARQIKSGKKPRCPVEKYAFRMKFENTVDGGQVMSFDTGRIVFTVKNGAITSQDTGPLILSSAKDQRCYAKRDSGAWLIEGNANLTGGRFPYTVRGTDDGETLNLVLAQQGAWRVTGDGSLECQMLIGLADAFLNAYPRMLNEGFPLPAGISDWEESESGVEFHEPTGENRPWSSYFEFRMLEPKR